jgi:hypothetical protein
LLSHPVNNVVINYKIQISLSSDGICNNACIKSTIIHEQGSEYVQLLFSLVFLHPATQLHVWLESIENEVVTHSEEVDEIFKVDFRVPSCANYLDDEF